MTVGKINGSTIITNNPTIERTEPISNKQPMQYVHPNTGPLNTSLEIKEILSKAKTGAVKESATENINASKKISFKELMSRLFTTQNILIGLGIATLITLAVLIPILAPTSTVMILAVAKSFISIAFSFILIGGAIAGIAAFIKKHGDAVTGHKSKEPGDDGKNLDQDTKRLERHAKLNHNARIENIHNIHHAENNTVK